MKRRSVLIIFVLLLITIVGGCGGGTKKITEKVTETIKLYNNDPNMEGVCCKSTSFASSKKLFDNSKMDYLPVGFHENDEIQDGFFTFSLKELLDKKIDVGKITSAKLFFHRLDQNKNIDIYGNLTVDCISYDTLGLTLLDLKNNPKNLIVYDQPSAANCWFYADYTDEFKNIISNKRYIQFRVSHSKHDSSSKSYAYDLIHSSKADNKYIPYILVEYEQYL